MTKIQSQLDPWPCPINGTLPEFQVGDTLEVIGERCHALAGERLVVTRNGYSLGQWTVIIPEAWMDRINAAVGGWVFELPESMFRKVRGAAALSSRVLH